MKITKVTKDMFPKGKKGGFIQKLYKFQDDDVVKPYLKKIKFPTTKPVEDKDFSNLKD